MLHNNDTVLRCTVCNSHFYYYPQQANESEYLGEFNLYYIYLLIWFIYLFEFVLVQIGTNK